MGRVTSILGVLASSCQMMGSLCFNKHLETVPVLGAFPKMIGSLFFVSSGIFWFMEALYEDLPKQSTSRWEYIKSQFDLKADSTPKMVWGFAAGAFSLVSGALFLIAANPLFLAASAFTIASSCCWYMGAKSDNKASNHMNSTAAALQIASTVLFVATLIIAPYVPPAIGLLLGFAAIFTSYLSPALWISSYGVAEMEEQEPLKKPVTNQIRFHPRAIAHILSPRVQETLLTSYSNRQSNAGKMGPVHRTRAKL